MQSSLQVRISNYFHTELSPRLDTVIFITSNFMIFLISQELCIHFRFNSIFRSNSASRGIFRSPLNVFMFGRGGSSNISCTIRFEGNADETVRYVFLQKMIIFINFFSHFGMNWVGRWPEL